MLCICFPSDHSSRIMREGSNGTYVTAIVQVSYRTKGEYSPPASVFASPYRQEWQKGLWSLWCPILHDWWASNILLVRSQAAQVRLC